MRFFAVSSAPAFSLVAQLTADEKLTSCIALPIQTERSSSAKTEQIALTISVAPQVYSSPRISPLSNAIVSLSPEIFFGNPKRPLGQR